jgi:hypothetical protein
VFLLWVFPAESREGQDREERRESQQHERRQNGRIEPEAAPGHRIEAINRVASFAVLIMVMLGGAWVPSFIFPAWLQRLTVVIPVGLLVAALGKTAAATSIASLSVGPERPSSDPNRRRFVRAVSSS